MKISQVVVAAGCLILLSGYLAGTQIRTTPGSSTPVANFPKVCIGDTSVYDEYSDGTLDNRLQCTKAIDLQTNTDKQNLLPPTLNLKTPQIIGEKDYFEEARTYES